MDRFLSLWLLFLSWGAWANPQTLDLPFHRGVNLSVWFQPTQARALPFSLYTQQDFRDLKALGCDVVRLPVNVVALAGPGPRYSLDPQALNFLDQALNWAESEGLSLVLDNHSDLNDPRIKADLGPFLKATWVQLATRYKGRPATLFYEVLNEPHHISAGDWGQIQKEVIRTIRAVDPLHTIVVGGVQWNSVSGLIELPAYEDPNLIYTFHFYDPMAFTHQGASWAGLKDKIGVRFQSAWTQDLGRTLDKAVNFARSRQVRLWCGEFGVYNLKADPSDRVLWYRAVRELLDKRQIPWTSWDCRDSFGLFLPGSAETFAHDLNVPLAEALGFSAPTQSPAEPRTVQGELWLYRDSWEGGTRETSWANRGTVDFYDGDRPHSGVSCLRLSGVPRYSSVAWQFQPRVDLGALADKGGISFWARASAPVSFDVRLVDGTGPGTGDGGLPWRLSKTIDPGLLPGDGQWHLVEVPFAAMAVTGAWDGTWHNGYSGVFDWDRVERLEIAAETQDLDGVDLGFDDLQIR